MLTLRLLFEQNQCNSSILWLMEPYFLTHDIVPFLLSFYGNDQGPFTKAIMEHTNSIKTD